MSRGSIFTLSAGTRRGLVLLWSALLMCSLILQYSVIAPATALAINPDTFELDGNVEGSAAPGDDWNPISNGNGSAFETIFVTDQINGNGDKYFDGGQTKDTTNIPAWLWTTVSQPQDKNDIAHAYAAAYRDGEDLVVYVGMDRYASNGAGQVGWWFLQGEFGLTGGPATGAFAGTHTNGDILVQVDFENGGASPQARVYEWDTAQADNLRLIQASGSCATAVDQDICAIASTGPTDPDWTFDDKGTAGASNNIPAGGMVEAGINLTELGLDDGCYASFLAETRSSPSEDSTLSDFAFGNFALCSKPDIKTDVKMMVDGQSTNIEANGAINVGETVYDRAVLTGDSGVVTGDVKFYLCRSGSTWPDCSSGGDQLGAMVQLSGGVAESETFTPGFTPKETGYYCFRAEYIPATGSKYFAAEHTNQTTECFKVIPAEIEIVKTRDAASVSAGDPIGFTITVSNIGEGKAYGVSATDTLPTGFAWTIESKVPADANWAISADGKTLTYGAASMLAGASTSVHIVSPTTAADCGPVTNDASVTTTNDGLDADSASLEILCPDVIVHKTPNAGSVNRGEVATFTIVAENIGKGDAKNVVVTDNLPAGLDWSTSSAGCSITGLVGSEVLTCNVGTLAAGAESAEFTVTADTDLAKCEAINNLAVVQASNEAGSATGNNTDPGAITVLCATIDIEKIADDATVNAGEQIGFTITVSNNGAGTAYDVEATDTLDGDFTWAIESEIGTTVGSWTLDAGVLTYTADALTMADGPQSVHIVAGTTAEQCKVVSNTANVTTGNDGDDTATDTTEILCPDVMVEKTPDTGSISAGDDATFTIKVTNIGDGLAKDVEVSDELPAGLDWSTSDADCEITGAIGSEILTCKAGDLAKGESKTYTVTADTDLAACTVIDNTATVTATNEATGDVRDNNSDDGSIAVNCPDITVEKTPDNGVVNATDKASFSMTVTNLGPGLARDVTLTDPLPGSGLVWTLVDGYDGTCAITAGLLECSFGNLAEDATATVTVEAMTTTEVCGPLMNTATVAADNEAAGATAPNTDDGLITVNCPDIKVLKTAGDDLIDAGATASFTVTVENIGEGMAYNVTLDDPLPAGITWLITNDDQEACDIVEGDLECTFGDMAPGEPVSVSVAGVTDAEDCSVLTNIATGFADNEPSDRETRANNVSQAEITVQCPNLVVEKTPDGAKINAGDTASFGIKITNEGPAVARDVKLSDPLPAGIAWVVDDTEHCSITDLLLECEFSALQDDESVTVNVSGSTDFENCKLLENTATVSGSNEPQDAETLADNSDDGDINCLKPEVGIVKSELSPVVNAGDEIGFEITVANNGDGVAYQVKVEDLLPVVPGVSWWIDEALSDDGFAIVDGKLVYGPADLAAKDDVTVVIKSDTTPASCSVVDNTATLTYQGGQPAENDASVTIQCPDVTVVKTAGNGEISAGAQASFTMTITNVGEGLAKNPTLTDELPAGIDWSENSIYCSIDEATNTLECAFPDMEFEDSYSVTVTGMTSNEVCGVIPNLAKVAAENEANTSNNEDGAEIQVNCPDLTITKTAVASPVLLGQDVVFEITATNAGPGTAYDVVVTDTLPAGLAWTDNSEECAIAADVLTCQVGTLAEGATFTVRISAPTMEALEACSSPEMIDNTATVSGSNETTAEEQLPNESSASVQVQCADISLVKVAAPAADGTILKLDKPGSVTFEYTVKNTGSAALTNFALVDDHATPGNTSDDVAVLNCPQTTLQPGAEMKCSITLPVTVGTWTNTAKVTATPVLDTESEVSDSDDAVVSVPEPVKPTPKPTPRVTPPPTSTIEGADSGTTGTTGLLLVLAALAGFMLAAGYMRPARATARKRSRRG